MSAPKQYMKTPTENTLLIYWCSPCFKDLLYFPRTVQISWHHICPYLSTAYLSSNSTVCLGSVLITMVGSLKWALRLQEPPRDSCTQTCTHVHTLSLDWSFCCSCSAFGNRHFMMAEWRMQRKAGTLKNCIFAKGKLFRSDTSHSLASHMEKFERHIIHLGSTHHRIAQARLLCIIPNVSLSHVPSYTPPLLAEFFSFFTLG